MDSKNSPELPKSAIAHSRFIKEFADEENIGLKGNWGAELEDILPRVQEITSELELKNPEFINRQREKFGEYLADIPESRVRKVYDSGLAISFKLQYRLLNRISPDEVENLKDDDYIKNSVIAYTFDFFRALKIAQTLDIAPQTGLDLAQKAYRVNPNTVLELIDQFPELPLWIAVRAITQHSRPGDYLAKLTKTVDDLGPEFSDFPRSDLVRAAMQRPDNTVQFLKEVRGKINELQPKFPEFTHPIFVYAAMHHTQDTEQFLERTRGAINKLSEEFPEITKRQILDVAIRYEDPAAFLQNLGSRINELQSQFPEFFKTLIARAVLDNKKPEKFLSQIRNKVNDLTKVFPEFNKTDITQVAFGHTSDPESFLRNAQKVIEELRREFPESKRSSIIRATLYYPDNPREGLKHYEDDDVT